MLTPWEKWWVKQKIKEIQANVFVLKKELPAPTKLYENNNLVIPSICPICSFITSYPYCSVCGQRLVKNGRSD